MVDTMRDEIESVVVHDVPAAPADDQHRSTLPRQFPWISSRTWITIALVVFATGFVIWNLRPGLWLDNTTPTGGDMGAHVWSPAYLRDVLLPNFRLTGWSPDWYAGFPAFTFYMVIPSLFIVILNVGLAGPLAIAASGLIAAVSLGVRSRYAHSRTRIVALYSVAGLLWLLVIPINYGPSMKLVVVAGLVALPVAAWSAGKLGGLAFPGPALLAVMTLPFLFDRSYNIYGGNLMSTMAGEFAYSLGLLFAVVYIGVAAKGIETGRHKGLAAALLALAGLTHLFAAFFAIVVTVALFLVRPGTRQLVWVWIVGPLAFLVSAFWVLPFVWNRALLNDMGWGKERRYVAALWNRSGSFGDQDFLANDPPLQIFVILAIVGALLSGIRRVRLGVALSLVAMAFATAFLVLPESRLWNVRILPFYYLSIYLMAGIAVSEMGQILATVGRSGRAALRRAQPDRVWVTAAPAVLATVVLFISLGLPLRSLPGGGLNDEGEYSWLGGLFTTSALNLGPSWVSHNFNGYEGTAAYGEYSLMVATMDRVGTEFGCGRALWEYESGRLGSYGTPMAPMLLPHWTGGCIGSMEGLYFEASATTPYHFLLQSELSAAPSRAQRDLPYSSLDVGRGADHLRDLGVSYYMAFSEEAVRQGRDEASFTEIATAGPWVVFLVDDADLVVALDHLPVVFDGADAGGEDWLVPTVAWWEADDAPLVAADGPDSWPRTSWTELEQASPALADLAGSDTGRVAEMRELAALFPTALERESVELITVSDVFTDTDSISFTVDEPGTPVLVRTSYFPNWEASGADGPYRVAPNLMVVIPTDTEVELTYGRSSVELVSILLSIIGLVGLTLVARLRPWSTDAVAWDLAGGGDHYPSRESVFDGLADGSFTGDDLDDLSGRVAGSVRAGLKGFVVASGAIVVSVLSFAIVRPSADDAFAALATWLPAGIGVIAMVFVVIPRLVGAIRCDYFVIDPARFVIKQVTESAEVVME